MTVTFWARASLAGALAAVALLSGSDEARAQISEPECVPLGLYTVCEPTVTPRRRAYTSMAYDSMNNEILLFGGFREGTIGEPDEVTYSDTWFWRTDPSKGKLVWSFLREAPGFSSMPPTKEAGPFARASASIAYDAVRGQVVVFGGFNQGGRLGDTWTWNSATQVWTLENTHTQSPSLRSGAAMAFDGMRAVLYGGIDELGRPIRDTWAWNGTKWAPVDGVTAPPALYGATMARNPGGGVVLFGGRTSKNADAFFGETWVFKNGWQKISVASSPPARAEAAMIQDEATGKVVLYGGTGSDQPGATPLRDTWTWDGTTWTKVGDEAGRPRTSRGVSMAYHPDGSVLFGGFGVSGQTLADTTVWQNGAWSIKASWTQISSVTDPPSTYYAPAMAYDPARKNLLLVGSTLNGTTSDVWTWTASEGWKSRGTVGTTSRHGAFLTYDGTYMMLFGGEKSDGTRLDDQWLWDGSSWQPAVVPSNSGDPPKPTSFGAATYDPVANRAVLYGGRGTDPSASGYTVPFIYTWDPSRGWRAWGYKTKPLGREGHAMAFNPSSGKTLLFGGARGTTFFNDVWEWQEQSWTQISAGCTGCTNMPAARLGGGLVWDPVGKRMALFGGLGVGGALFGDMWRLNPSTYAWSVESPDVKPEPRYFAPLASFEPGESLVLFGGVGSGGVTNGETWVY